ncbi:hypothetical protein, unlikely [Trypanosoma brucei gambiense DAL972]|uniref:Uncharacterized protein n=1 Tax=Trypanosoma brucei gambiense (strain MHOM/CI/86/DAL972) TaxID=679716 RepID=D0A9E8_TRYB9|nr:hypothetical protein, unlikely [Trypanosoma brucei gambiense DAL972]CBH18299.1 hypothetical protein, unlikely [Trypanosoma brucei gambiense DAL972]|eukprot:XP_011780563.1 hypothetical protein, unlikely [Trypanosoma brucei gambiense DAL972]
MRLASVLRVTETECNWLNKMNYRGMCKRWRHWYGAMCEDGIMTLRPKISTKSETVLDDGWGERVWKPRGSHKIACKGRQLSGCKTVYGRGVPKYHLQKTRTHMRMEYQGPLVVTASLPKAANRLNEM